MARLRTLMASLAASVMPPPVPPALGPACAKTFFEGTQRTCPPEETLDRVRPHLAQMGITRLADITGLDTVGIPVAQAIRPMGRSLSVKQGKGATLAAALASAAVEAAEAWHAETFRPATRRGTARQLRRTHRVCDLDGLAAGPGPLEGTVLTWVRASNLVDGAVLMVPFDCVHLDFVRPAETDLLDRSSNGLAGGNTLAGAVLHALLEMIERDALASFWTLPERTRRARRIDAALAAQSDPVVALMLERIVAAGLHLELFDATNDLAVPSVLARIYGIGTASAARFGAGVSGASLGHGAHLNPAIALSRAVSEAAQSRLTRIAGSRDDLTPRHYRPATGGNLPRLMTHVLDRSAHGYRAFDYADLSAGTAADDVAVLVARLRSAGLDQILMLDLSRDLPIHAARVVIPGIGRMVRHDVPLPGRRFIETVATNERTS